MTAKIRPSEDGQFIEMIFVGEINRRIAMEQNQAAHTLGTSLGIRSYLADVTRAPNTDSVLDQYNFAYQDMRQNEAVDRTARIAILIDPADHSHDFIETVGRNSGLNMKIFTCRQRAIEFLSAEHEI